AKPSGGTFEFDRKAERLGEVNRELENPRVWDDPERAQALGRERSALERTVNTIRRLDKGLGEAADLLQMARAERDAETADAVVRDLDRLEQELKTLEFQRMFPGEMDPNNAFL